MVKANIDTDLKVEYRSTNELIPFARNSRKHSEAQIAQIAASIKEFGWTSPILIDGTNGIIAGHGRLAAAQKLGYEKVPTIELSHLSETQKRALVIADNRLALSASWDEDMLKLELEELNIAEYDLAFTGFDTDEIKKLLTFSHSEPGLTDDDAVPSAEPKGYSRLGDLWVLGDHRLLCGDSTKLEQVERLVAGQKADMIFTDPPYGMSYGGGRAAGSSKKGARVKAHGEIIGDDMRGTDLIQMVQDAIANAKKGSASYICFTWRTYGEFKDALKQCGLEPASCIVWDKKSIGLGLANYRPQHEFIFYCKGDFWCGDKGQSDVWYMSRGSVGEYVHPTQKPVELIERALNNSSKQGDNILDLFGGSGSTLIACQKTGRRGHLMELDPKYVDVIVKRWQDFSGKVAVLESDGRSFDVVIAERRKSDE